MQKTWHLMEADADKVRALTHSLCCHPVVATVLANRRLDSPEKAQAFLTASLSQLRPPTSLRDLDKAVQRIAGAITARENILLFGDYDVDGTTATSVLLEFLKTCGALVSWYIPHRLREGYGLKPRHIAEVAVPRQASLMITVDCGSASHAAVDAARAAGIDVIITDHHNLQDSLPEAVAVVNPKRSDCPSGLEHLAGVGVAFCLVIALRKHLRDNRFWEGRSEPNLRSLCDLVALGTIADMVPLLDDNRILAKAGLELISSARRPGLAALIETCGISNRPAEAEDVAYRIGPRLNAAGRVDHAGLSVELMTTDRMDTAREIARRLNILNANRQELEKGILADIDTILRRQPEMLERRTLVLAQPGWHDGVIGVVASRVLERYYRPVVLIALKGDEGHGSARGIPGIDLHACLTACGAHLEDLGGHALAAGLRVRTDRLPAFQQAFEEAVLSRSAPEVFIPRIAIDAVLNFDEISENLVDQLESLMPYGSGNPEPLFLAPEVAVVSSAWVGNNHRRMTLRQPGRGAEVCLQAIQFNADPGSAAQSRFARLAFKLRWNRWNGSRTVQLVVEEVAAV
jgi:single-stranded-DNA-specific exonuclease